MAFRHTRYTPGRRVRWMVSWMCDVVEALPECKALGSSYLTRCLAFGSLLENANAVPTKDALVNADACLYETLEVMYW